MRDQKECIYIKNMNATSTRSRFSSWRGKTYLFKVLCLIKCCKSNFTFIELKHTENTPKIMPPESKEKKVDNNVELENTSAYFNTLIYPEESINK